LTKLFGQEAAKPLSVFINKGVAGFDEMNKRMAAQADMQKKIQSIMSGTKMQWETMTGSAETLTANVGGLFARLINLPGLLGGLNILIGKMNDWVIANPKTAGAIGGVVAVVAALSLAGGGALLAISGIGAAIGPFLGGMAALSRIFGMVGGGIRMVVMAFNVLRIAMLANPVGLTITAIAVAALLIYKYWGPITQFFQKIWKSVADLAGKMREAGAKLITSLWEGIKSMAMKPVEAIKAIAQKIRNHLPFSPAKEGPLRDIHRIRLVETIAETIKPGPMASAMRRAVNTTMQVASSAPMRGALAGDGGAIVNFSPVYNINGGDVNEIRKAADQAATRSLAEFERMFARMQAQQQRRRY
jgi:phage-related protein